MLRRFWALLQKEFIQLFRDRRTMILLLVMPPVQLTLFAAAIHTDVKHIPMVVADQSLSAASRGYLDAMTGSESFDITAVVPAEADVVRAIDSGQANLGLVIPPDFATRTQRGDAQVLMLVDGSSSFTSQSAYNAANAISQQFAVSLGGQQGGATIPLTAHIQILYNPDITDLWFVLPGMIALLLQGFGMALTALAIVREREVGTIEALLVTPIRPFEFMLAKTAPSLALATTDTVIILIFGTVVLGVPFQGDLVLFLALAVMFAAGCLGLGLLISTLAQTQAQAQQLSSLVNISSMFLGGVLFPAYALPPLLHYLSYIFPTTFFVPISRGIVTKGVGLEALLPQVLGLALLLVVLVYSSVRRFRQRLD